MGRAGFVPLDGVDQVGAASAADVKVLADLGQLRRDGVERRGLVEVDHLDRLPRRKDDSAYVVAVVGFAVHHDLLMAPSSAATAPAFTGDGRDMTRGALALA